MLTINNIKYKRNDLLNLIASKLQSFNTPSWEKNIYTFIEEWLSDQDYIVVETSGSTGEPKSIRLKKEWMRYSALQTCNIFNLSHDSNGLLCLPAEYIAGKMMIVRAFVSGMNLLTVEPSGNPFSTQSFNPPIAIGAINQSPDSHQGNQSIDFAAITPFQLSKSLEILKENPIVKTIIVGGGEISPWLEEQSQALPVDIYATYGMTETSSHIALRKVNGSDKQTSFSALGDTSIKVDSRGCLTIANPRLFNGDLITNDLVEIENDRKFRWIGRIDNVINSGGVKIMPEELEKSIAHLRPELMIVSSVSDDKLGESVALVIEIEDIVEAEKIKLLSQIRELANPYELPKHIICVKGIPRTQNGKVDRKAVKRIISNQ